MVNYKSTIDLSRHVNTKVVAKFYGRQEFGVLKQSGSAFYIDKGDARDTVVNSFNESDVAYCYEDDAVVVDKTGVGNQRLRNKVLVIVTNERVEYEGDRL